MSQNAGVDLGLGNLSRIAWMGSEWVSNRASFESKLQSINLKSTCAVKNNILLLGIAMFCRINELPFDKPAVNKQMKYERPSRKMTTN